MALTDDQLARRVTRYEVAKRLGILLTLVLVACSLAILLVLARQNRQTLTTVLDCTRQTGQCYQRGQQQTGQAVDNINSYIIAAASCATSLAPQASHLTRRQLQVRITDCVIASLRGRK